MRVAVIVCALLLSASCSSTHRDMDEMRPTGAAIDGVFSASFEATWSAIDQLLDEGRVERDVVDEVRGVIATGFVPARPPEDEMACTGLETDRGAAVDGVRYRLRFEVTRQGRSRTTVRLAADVQSRVVSAGGTGRWVDCTSTGEIERRILDAIERRLRVY